MNIQIPIPVARAWALSKPDCGKNVVDRMRYSSQDRLGVDLDELSPGDTDKLLAALAAEKDSPECAGLANKVNNYLRIKNDPSAAKVGTLQNLATAIKAYLRPTPNKWVFAEDEDGAALPYFVRSVVYHPRDERTETPAHVIMNLSFVYRGKKGASNLTWWGSDLRGKATVVDMLSSAGYYRETQELAAAYEKTLQWYRSVRDMTGAQVAAHGEAKQNDGYYRSRAVSMVVDGQPSKVVVDDEEPDGDESEGRDTDNPSVSNSFWRRKGGTGGEDDDDSDDAADPTVPEYGIAPEHPYVNVFDLARHSFCHVHSDHLKPYPWVGGLDAKLVLEADKKELVSMLVTSAGELMEDIVTGKTGGVVVMASGPPGTGKTLTAEVYADTIRRPLYNVQCSQLGLDLAAIEKNLLRVLRRATRWKAVLLIDEADVYVRARGEDMHQNAVVGVFLRVLEYYRGILFMTTNRATEVDDAIVSRLTAHVRYEVPDPEALRKLWEVLSAQYRVELRPATVGRLVERYAGATGRNVKNLLKLARMIAARHGAKPDLSTFESAANFLDLNMTVKTNHDNL